MSGSTVALGPWGRGETGGGNVFGAGGIMGIMSDAMKLRQEQSSFMAHQKAGQIVSTSPDFESGVKALATDPDVAGFAPDIMHTMAQTGVAMQELQGLKMTQSRGAMDDLLKAAAGALSDPSQLRSIVNTRMAMWTDDQRKRLEPAVGNWLESVAGNLPTDPQQATAKFRQNLTGQLLGAGLKPDDIAAAGGGVWMEPHYQEVINPDKSKSYIPVGGFIYPGAATTAPAAGGGGVGTPGAAGGGLPLSVSGGGGAGAAQPTTYGPGQVGPPLATGPSAVQEGAQDVAKQQTEASNETLQQAPQVIQTMDAIADTLKYFQSGGLANKQLLAAQDMQGLARLGVPFAKDLQDWITNHGMNGRMDKGQVLQKLANLYSTERFKETAPGGSTRLAIEARQFLNLIGPDTDPAAIVDLLNQTKLSVQRQVDQAAQWPEYRDSVPATQQQRLGDYLKWWNENRATRQRENYGGMNFKPYDPRDVLGTAHQYRENDMWKDKSTGVVKKFIKGDWVEVDPNTGNPLRGP